MLTVEEYRSKFLSYLENFQSPNNPKNLYEPVSYILSLKGKRIRPIPVSYTHLRAHETS